MKIEHFNNYESYLDFDRVTGQIQDVAEGNAEPVQGMGAAIEGTGAALLVRDASAWLNIGGKEFDLRSPDVSVRYVHHSSGTTSFEIADSRKRAEVIYPTWWNKEVGVPGLGANADEDEDFLGYVYFMHQHPDRLAHLVRRYSK